MLTLPSKFAAENAKPKNKPAYIVQVQENSFYQDQSLASDWAAAVSHTNVDYTTSPGDVTLTEIFPTEENQSYDGVLPGSYSPGGLLFLPTQIWQSFRQVTGLPRRLGKIRIEVDEAAANLSARVLLFAADKTTQIGVMVEHDHDIPAGAGWADFDFYGQNITIQNDTQYWIQVYDTYGTPAFSSFKYNSINIYARGELDFLDSAWHYNYGVLAFIVELTSDTQHVYEGSGNITVDFDLGAIPTVVGEFQTDDTVPLDDSLTYQIWGSDTGSFSGEEISLGLIEDGDAITSLHRYYRVTANFASNAAHDNTPLLSRLTLEFSTYRGYSNVDKFGYEPSIMSVSGLEAKIDPFNASTVSQISINMAHSPAVSSFLVTKYPKNKIVKFFAGFVADGFTEADFIPYATCQIDNWQIGTNDQVTLTTKGFIKEWDVNVPLSWNTTDDDVKYLGWHHVDVMLDLLYNRVRQRDSKINRPSFEAVKAALPGWTVTRTITGNPVSAKDLLQELRLLTSTFFLLSATGEISLKHYDPTEAARTSLTDDNTVSIGPYDGNAKSLINTQYTYIGWDGSGDQAKNFTRCLLYYPDDTSWFKWKEYGVNTVMDKWTLDNAQGETQINAMAGIVYNRFSDPAPILQAVIPRSMIALECGDMVLVTTKCAPSPDGNGIVDQKYHIVQRGLDFTKDTLKITLLRA